ncbi:MAG: cation diffusion facilitator family transporter [Gammaproteobacteria bacterium]|nr:cation diffusion facilitator family transporter [Gammaproteobacteria bacterium]
MRRPPPPLDPAVRARLLRSATYASMTVAISLVLAKAWAWYITDSVSMLSSLADSLLDTLASGLTFWAVRYSMSPADAEHRFGHGKSEGLAALIQGLIIAGSGLFVCWEAIKRFVWPQAVEEPDTGVAVMVAATLATIALVSYQRYVSRRTGSVAISADAMHYSTDLLVNIAVGTALYISAKTGWMLLDPVVGLGVGAFVLNSSAAMIMQSLDILLDHEIPDADRDKVRQIALAHPEVLGVHDLRTRNGGTFYILQFHLDLPPRISLWRSHEILDEVEDSIRQAFPDSDIIIHADPLGVTEEKDSF